jgi:hypothetical protein
VRHGFAHVSYAKRCESGIDLVVLGALQLKLRIRGHLLGLEDNHTNASGSFCTSSCSISAAPLNMRHLSDPFGCDGTSTVTTEAPQWRIPPAGLHPEPGQKAFSTSTVTLCLQPKSSRFRKKDPPLSAQYLRGKAGYGPCSVSGLRSSKRVSAGLFLGISQWSRYFEHESLLAKFNSQTTD